MIYSEKLASLLQCRNIAEILEAMQLFSDLTWWNTVYQNAYKRCWYCRDASVQKWKLEEKLWLALVKCWLFYMSYISYSGALLWPEKMQSACTLATVRLSASARKRRLAQPGYCAVLFERLTAVSQSVMSKWYFIWLLWLTSMPPPCAACAEKHGGWPAAAGLTSSSLWPAVQLLCNAACHATCMTLCGVHAACSASWEMLEAVLSEKHEGIVISFSILMTDWPGRGILCILFYWEMKWLTLF